MSIVKIILFILSIISIVAFALIVNYKNSKYRQCDKKETYESSSKIPLYVTTLSNAVSKKRSSAQRVVFNKFNLSNIKYNPALHWKHDAKKIERQYPQLVKDCKKFIDRKGAYGLTASFLQFINTNANANVNANAKLIGWVEDDVIPAGAEINLDATKDIVNQINKSYKVDHNIVKQFNTLYNNVLENLPKSINDVYFFGHTSYCNNKSLIRRKSDDLWIQIDKSDKYQAGGPGTSFIIFTPNAIKSIYKWVNENKIDLPIDMLFMKLIKDNIITGWEVNRSITYNKMFYGLFEQMGTYCEHRQNNTID
jgi:hypothetical protein